jgi:3-methyladenine DNA glycosylase AlkD
MTSLKSSSKAQEIPADAATLAAGIIAELRTLRNEHNIEGMRRFGIVTNGEQLGISMTQLRAIGRPYRRNHALALELWASAIHEARLLATLVDDPAQITRAQMQRWVRSCDNWAVTDAMAFLFDRTPFAGEMAQRWSRRKGEYVKRAAFSIIAGMAVHRKELADDVFLAFLPIIIREANDERNFVCKAVNWALRGIGKRNVRLGRAAVGAAQEIAQLDSRTARWIASDALRELRRQPTCRTEARPPTKPG